MKHFLRVLAAVLILSGGCAMLNRDPTAHYSATQLQNMGEKFLAARDYGQALQYLTMAEKKRPNDPAIQYSLGLAYYERGLRLDAYTHLKRALALKPDFPEAENALGRYYAEQGQLDQAQWSFEKAIANPFYQTPQFACYNLGLVFEKKGDLENALRQYQEAVRLDPTYGAAYFRIGQMQEHFRRGDEARAAYGKAIEYVPDLAEAHFRYGVMSYTAGELESAFYSLNRVLKLAPHSTMADESRRILEKLKMVLPSSQSARPAVEDIAQIDIVRNEELLKERIEATVTASSTTNRPMPDEPRQYVVQLGSYLDRDNAELLQRRLQSRGHKVAVKPFKHQVLGQLYVVQLHPVNDPDEATKLMMQVEGEGHGKAIIIEVPVD